jgi:uncharacterized oxidoreductase
MRLEERRILITGGGSGIGLELARRLAGSNHVVIAGRDEAKLERAQARTPALQTVRFDLNSEADAREAVTHVAQRLGGLDLLVNNAGVLRAYALSSAEAEANTVEDVQVNVVGALRMTRLALPLLGRSPEGAVLFVSSAVALLPSPASSSTQPQRPPCIRWRARCAPSCIRVFEVLPPVVDTGPVRNLDVPKLPPEAVANAIIAGLRRDREEIRVGRVRQLAPLARLMPRLADRIVTRSLTQPNAD